MFARLWFDFNLLIISLYQIYACVSSTIARIKTNLLNVKARVNKYVMCKYMYKHNICSG